MSNMLKTKRSVNAGLAQYFAAQESQDDAVTVGLQQQQTAVAAERARVLADDYAESKAIRAGVNAEISAGRRRAYAGTPWLRLPTVAPSVVPSVPEPASTVQDMDTFLAELDAKYGPLPRQA